MQTSLGQGQTPRTLAEGFDSPGQVFTASADWQVKTVTQGEQTREVVAMDHALTAETTLSTRITGPAVVTFQWRLDRPDVQGADAFFLGVDGGGTPVSRAWDAGVTWREQRLTIGAGSRLVSWRLVPGAMVELDHLTVTPLAAAPLLETLTPSAQNWVPDADSPPGVAGGSLKYTGKEASISLLGPGPAIVEGWVKMEGPEASYNYGWVQNDLIPFEPDITTFGEWRRVRGISGDGHCALYFYNYYGEGSALLAGFTATPIDLAGTVLDSPELAWTTSGGFRPTSRYSGEVFWMLRDLQRPTGGLETAPTRGTYTASATTTVQGPGKWMFWAETWMPWSVRGNNGAVLASWPGYDSDFNGTRRLSVDIPAGPQQVSIVAQKTLDDYGAHYLYETLFAVPAADALRDALDLPAGDQCLVRQASQGRWSRDTAVSRDGVDSLRLDAAPDQLADIILPVPATPRGGLWVKGSPGAKIFLQLRSGSAASFAELVTLSVPVEEDWNWFGFQKPPGCVDLRISVHQASQVTGPIWIDHISSESDGGVGGIGGVAVSVAEALDTPGRVWQSLAGPAGAAVVPLPVGLPSDAVGDNFLILRNGAAVSTTLPGPCQVRLRIRRLANESGYSGEVELHLDGGFAGRGWASHQQWTEVSTLLLTATAGSVLRVAADVSSEAMVDHVEIILTPETSLAEALDLPSGASVLEIGGWKGRGLESPFSHDGVDAVVSPRLLGGESATLTVPVAASGVGLDVSFWWDGLRYPWNHANVSFAFSGPSLLQHPGGGRSQTRVHYDRAPDALIWYASATKWDAAVQGDFKLDQLTQTARPVDSFQAALDTEQGGQGWSSMGSALARVQTEVTHDGVDALEISAQGGQQSVSLSGKLTGEGAELSFWARSDGPAGTLTATGLGNAALTSAWTRFSILLKEEEMPDSTITFNAILPAGGKIYLDQVSLTNSTDYASILESGDLAWTSGGRGRRTLFGDAFIACVQGPADYVSFSGLETGESGWLETTVTGPGMFLVDGSSPFTNFPDTRLSLALLVDGTLADRDGISSSGFGSFRGSRIQASVPAGQHTLRILVTQLAGPTGAVRVQSVAWLPGDPAADLPAAFAAVSAKTITVGGSSGVLPFYYLVEGVATLRGVQTPRLAPGQTCWLETTVPGDTTLTMLWSSSGKADCLVYGRKAAEASAPADINQPYLNLSIPARAGQAAAPVRLVGGEETTVLATFYETPNPGLGAVVDTPGQALVWVAQEYWAIPAAITDAAWPEWDNAHGRTQPSAGGGHRVLKVDFTASHLWITGPAVLTFEQAAEWSLPALTLDGAPVQPSADTTGRWTAVAVVIPAGDHRLDVKQDSISRFGKFRLREGTAYQAWATPRLAATAVSSPYEDPDGDGASNLTEYALGSDPNAAQSSPAPVLSLSGSPATLTLSVPTPAYTTPDVSCVIQGSTDLKTWTNLIPVPAAAPGAPDRLIPLPATATAAGKRFFRVRVGY